MQFLVSPPGEKSAPIGIPSKAVIMPCSYSTDVLGQPFDDLRAVAVRGVSKARRTL